MVEIKFKKLVPNALIPAQMKPGDTGFCIRAVNRIILSPYNIMKVRTGLAVDIPEGYEIQIRGKSGPALEKGLVVAQGIGTIDSGYKDEVFVVLKNGRPYTTIIESGEALAQFVVKEVPKVVWKEVDKIEKVKKIKEPVEEEVKEVPKEELKKEEKEKE